MPMRPVPSTPCGPRRICRVVRARGGRTRVAEDDYQGAAATRDRRASGAKTGSSTAAPSARRSHASLDKADARRVDSRSDAADFALAVSTKASAEAARSVQAVAGVPARADREMGEGAKEP